MTSQEFVDRYTGLYDEWEQLEPVAYEIYEDGFITYRGCDDDKFCYYLLQELTDNERPESECNHVDFWVTLISAKYDKWYIYHFDKDNNYIERVDGADNS